MFDFFALGLFWFDFLVPASRFWFADLGQNIFFALRLLCATVILLALWKRIFCDDFVSHCVGIAIVETHFINFWLWLKLRTWNRIFFFGFLQLLGAWVAQFGSLMDGKFVLYFWDKLLLWKHVLFEFWLWNNGRLGTE